MGEEGLEPPRLSRQIYSLLSQPIAQLSLLYTLQGSNLWPVVCKTTATTIWATPSCWGESGIRTRGSVKISGFQDRCTKPTLPSLLIVVPQGFEPHFHGPKPHVLPLDERTIMKPICQRTFSFEVSIRFELMTPGYKAGILPTILRVRFFGYKKTRTFLVRVLYSFYIFS